MAVTSSSTIWSSKTKLVIRIPMDAANQRCKKWMSCFPENHWKPKYHIVDYYPPLNIRLYPLTLCHCTCSTVFHCVTLYSLIFPYLCPHPWPSGPRGSGCGGTGAASASAWPPTLVKRGFQMGCWGPWKLGELTKLRLSRLVGVFNTSPKNICHLKRSSYSFSTPSH